MFPDLRTAFITVSEGHESMKAVSWKRSPGDHLSDGISKWDCSGSSGMYARKSL